MIPPRFCGCTVERMEAGFRERRAAWAPDVQKSREGGDMSKLTLTRRGFTKLAAITGAAAAMSTVASHAALAASETAASSGSEVKRVRSCCRGCGKMECGVWVTVQDGRVIRTEGDESAFQSAGSHCAKGQASLQAAYHPDRLRYPLKRTNPKDNDDPGWQRISWDGGHHRQDHPAAAGEVRQPDVLRHERHVPYLVDGRLFRAPGHLRQSERHPR